MQGTRIELPIYDAMCRAIHDVYENDPLEGITDPGDQLRLAEKIATNTDAERQAREIRSRAERECKKIERQQRKELRETIKAEREAFAVAMAECMQPGDGSAEFVTHLVLHTVEGASKP